MLSNKTRPIAALGLFVCCLALPVCAQDARLRIDHLDRLAERATEAVEVSLDQAQLQFVRKLARLDPADHGDKLARMNSVFVRLYEFEQDGEVAEADVEAIRAQLRGSGWRRFVDGSNAGGDAFVMRQGGEIAGYAALYADPRKLCVINVTGQISEEDVKEFNRSDCRGWNGNRRTKR